MDGSMHSIRDNKRRSILPSVASLWKAYQRSFVTRTATLAVAYLQISGSRLRHT